MSVIKNFQLSCGLKPDGDIGPKTLGAIRAKLNKSKEQIANYMGQYNHETGGFKYATESLNYSAERLMQVFDYYKTKPGEAYMDGKTVEHKSDPETIANKVYWDRNRSKSHWLGNKHWGDGWKFRGRGLPMTTGMYNYAALGNHLKVNLVDNPELVATDFYWEAGEFYFETKNLWEIAKEVNVESMTLLTEKINGGRNGLKERMRMTRYYLYLQNL